jgi:TPP-dependent pyruvate/acetoin dehydrogenase alpha subunit
MELMNNRLQAMNKSEKDISKQIQNELRKKASDAFEASLPTSRTKLEELFDYLNEELQEQECDNKPTLARTFLENQNITNVEAVL